jgi:hypothetical protein
VCLLELVGQSLVKLNLIIFMLFRGNEKYV